MAGFGVLCFGELCFCFVLEEQRFCGGEGYCSFRSGSRKARANMGKTSRTHCCAVLSLLLLRIVRRGFILFFGSGLGAVCALYVTLGEREETACCVLSGDHLIETGHAFALLELFCGASLRLQQTLSVSNGDAASRERVVPVLWLATTYTS